MTESKYGKRKVDMIIVHCSATKPSQDIGANELDFMHRQRGFIGCGYHIVIRRDGSVETEAKGFKCRPLSRAGAHVGDCGLGYNQRSLGVCLVGGVSEHEMMGVQPKPEQNFTDAQYQSLREVLSLIRGDLPRATIMGHRDLIKITHAPPKACPCFNVREWLDREPQNSFEQKSFTGTPSLWSDSPLSAVSHKVVAGDSLWKISTLYRVPVADLKKFNGLTSDTIVPEQVIRLHSH